MQFKKYTKQRLGGIQGLRSFKDTLPTKVKKLLKQKGEVYSELIENWRMFVGDELFSCLLYTSPSPRDMRRSRMPSSA